MKLKLCFEVRKEQRKRPKDLRGMCNRRTQKLNQYDLDLNDFLPRKCLKGKNSYPAQGKKCRVKILTLG